MRLVGALEGPDVVLRAAHHVSRGRKQLQILRPQKRYTIRRLERVERLRPGAPLRSRSPSLQLSSRLHRGGLSSAPSRIGPEARQHRSAQHASPLRRSSSGTARASGRLHPCRDEHLDVGPILPCSARIRGLPSHSTAESRRSDVQLARSGTPRDRLVETCLRYRAGLKESSRTGGGPIVCIAWSIGGRCERSAAFPLPLGLPRPSGPASAADPRIGIRAALAFSRRSIPGEGREGWPRRRR
jgi:hypothetical protein